MADNNKVAITKTKLDTLADKISAKSGEAVPLTLDGMGAAVDGIQTGGTYQAKTKTYTPTETAQTEHVTPDSGYDALSAVDIVVNGYVKDLVKLAEVNIGNISTTSTSAVNPEISVPVSGVNPYDLIIVVTHCARANGRHLATINTVMLTGTSNIATKNASNVATATTNIKLSSSGVASSRASTTKYGVYVNAAALSSGTLTLTMYERYNSTQTGTINGNYTVTAYGVKLYDII